MMELEQIKAYLESGQAVVGMELGSTRIKAVLLDDQHKPLASGGYDWENQLVDGLWTYSLEAVWTGVQQCFAKLKADVLQQYGVQLTTLKAIGFSAMMHGYLVFNKEDRLLVPFRTWRNTNTEQAANALTTVLGFNIPQRWNIAHLYQAILNGEDHVKDVAYLTTLAGYVHWQLTGQKVLGVGDASGMFPIDSATCQFDEGMLATFDKLIAPQGFSFTAKDILPTVLKAGENAGTLTAGGALLLDPTGALQAGIPLAPPEGDAGTGMVATNSVGVRTGNVSAGTSIFAMAVLERPLSKVYPEIDLVTTPTGEAVAMVHCNNCTSDINAWAALFCQFSAAVGTPCTMPQALDALFFEAQKGDVDCGGLLSYNYLSGEQITYMEEGRPLFARLPDAHFTFPNFARTQIYSAIATLKLGMDMLFAEQVQVDTLYGHGGFFKAKGVGQQMMASALETPISVMETAGEGGAWGMALLAAYLVDKKEEQSLADYLTNRVFDGSIGSTLPPNPPETAGFESFMARYTEALPIEKSAITNFHN